MTSNLSRCVSWKFNRDEYTIDDNENLIITSYNTTPVPKGDYFINRRNESITCIPPYVKLPSYYVDMIYICLWLISWLSLVASIALDCKNKTFKCWPIFFHKLCLMVFYSVVIIFSANRNNDVTFWFVRYVSEYAIIAAFCWVTTFNWQVWKRFSPSVISRSSSSGKKLLVQSLFAWGIPALIVSIATVWKYFRIKNLFDRKTLSQSDPEVVFSNVCTEIILAINLVLFALTIRNLHLYGSAVVRANTQIFKQLPTVYLKLMIVTGVIWIIQVLEWILTSATSWLFVVGIPSSLQGFFLFLVYHFKIFNCKHFKRKYTAQPPPSSSVVTIA